MHTTWRCKKLKVARVAAWEASADAPCGGEGWAQFGGDAFPPPVDPFARSDGLETGEGPVAPAEATPSAPAAPAADSEVFQRQEFSSFWPSAERDPAAGTSPTPSPRTRATFLPLTRNGLLDKDIVTLDGDP